MKDGVGDDDAYLMFETIEGPAAEGTLVRPGDLALVDGEGVDVGVVWLIRAVDVHDGSGVVVRNSRGHGVCGSGRDEGGMDNSGAPSKERSGYFRKGGGEE